MKKYLLFAGDTYYARGGWLDLKLSSDTIENAKAGYEADEWSWGHIVDRDTGQLLETIGHHLAADFAESDGWVPYYGG